MPKDTKTSSESTHYHPYASQSESGIKIEEIQCPICFETPHNPVLLMCASHEKGCHPYMCNTGPALSNCFDQFQKTPVSSKGILCPLCRGEVTRYVEAGWGVDFMNSTPRDCSQENCEFNESYDELMKHVVECHSQEEEEEPQVESGNRVQIPYVATSSFVSRGGRRMTTGREYKRRIRAIMAAQSGM